MPDVPSELKAIQQQEVDFRSPCSESTLQKIAASLNYILDHMDFQAVGSIVPSYMTEDQFQDYKGTPNWFHGGGGPGSATTTTWILADGRAITGSRLNTEFGYANAPHLLGLFIRGYNDGRTGSFANPDNTALASTQTDANNSHKHQITITNSAGPDFASLKENSGDAYPRQEAKDGTDDYNVQSTELIPNLILGASGGAEFRPENITVNFFVRIN